MAAMEIHPLFGPVLSEEGWVPAPRYLLRRQLVLERLVTEVPGKLLDIGCGPGALLYELSTLGWSCSSLEQSEQALAIARKVHRGPDRAAIFESPSEFWVGHFDWIVCMEVLEHIEDDLTALRSWREWLRPGGRLLFSVPAHMRKWNPSDVWAGHFRRYERDQLKKLLEEAGFTVEDVWSYGFPVSNLIEPVRGWLHGRLMKQAAAEEKSFSSKREGTNRSGTDRSLEKRLFPLAKGFLGATTFRFSDWLQRRFLRSDLGTGYLALACKPGS